MSGGWVCSKFSELTSEFLNLNSNHVKDTTKFQFTISLTLLTSQNIYKTTRPSLIDLEKIVPKK